MLTPEPVLKLTPKSASIWVSSAVLDSGDGSQAHPFKTLPEALTRAQEVHLLAGLYRGPFELPGGARLVGHGLVVLYAEGPVVVVRASDAVIEGVQLQGGQVGLEMTGTVTLEKVGFSGHRASAARVFAGGALFASDLKVEGTIEGSVGLRVDTEGRALVKSSLFTGGLKRAVDVSGQIELVDVTSQGPKEALHLVDGAGTVRGLTVSGGSGPAIFAGSATLTVDQAQFVGHEYGVQARASELKISNLRSSRALMAGVALVQCRASLNAVTLESPGSFGGLQLLASQVQANDVRVKAATSAAVVVRQGTARLTRLTVEGVRSEREGLTHSGGDGLVVRGGVVTLEGAQLTAIDGIALSVAAQGLLTVRDVSVAGCLGSSVAVDQSSSLTGLRVALSKVEIPPLWVSERSTVQLTGLSLDVEGEAVFADCSVDASVTLTALKGAGPQTPQRCVTLVP